MNLPSLQTNLRKGESERKDGIYMYRYKKIYRVTKSIEKSRNNKYLPKSSKNTQIVKIQ